MSEKLSKLLKTAPFFVCICSLLMIYADNCLAKPKITNMQAKLFYQNTGKFSEDVFAAPSDLWNVVFDYVYSTLVIVEVEGGEPNAAHQKLELVARYIPFEGSKRQITVRKTSPLWFDEQGKTFVSFWVDNVGCHPVKLSANIKGQKTIMRKTIDFGCGE